MQQRIKTFIAPGEGGREEAMRLAIANDPRFEPLQIDSSIPVDVQFTGTPRYIGHDLMGDEYVVNIFNCELKECSDYISSALGKDGHLYCQHLSMRESGHPAMILVLGSDLDVSNAIIDSLQTRYRGKELAFQISNYEARLQDFEARSFANGIPVMRWKARPFSRLLSTAAQVLGDPSMMGFRMRPAAGERDIAAASMLFKGIGSESMKLLLKEYDLKFCPKPGARPVEEIPGFGKKRCETIRHRIKSNP